MISRPPHFPSKREESLSTSATVCSLAQIFPHNAAAADPRPGDRFLCAGSRSRTDSDVALGGRDWGYPTWPPASGSPPDHPRSALFPPKKWVASLHLKHRIPVMQSSGIAPPRPRCAAMCRYRADVRSYAQGVYFFACTLTRLEGNQTEGTDPSIVTRAFWLAVAHGRSSSSRVLAALDSRNLQAAIVPDCSQAQPASC